MSQFETCANCGTTIGRLETPHVWQEQVVCAPCFQRLMASAIPYAAPIDESDIPESVTPYPAPEFGVAFPADAIPYTTPIYGTPPSLQPRPLEAEPPDPEPVAQAEPEYQQPTCGRCGSPDLASFEMVYNHGSSVTSSASLAFFGSGLGLIDTASTTTTRLAARVAPPTKKGYFAAVVLAGFGAVLAGVGLGDSNGWMATAGLVLAFIGFVLLISTLNWNRVTWPFLYGDWKSKWVCRSCGYCFKRRFGSARVRSVVRNDPAALLADMVDGQTLPPPDEE